MAKEKRPEKDGPIEWEEIVEKWLNKNANELIDAVLKGSSTKCPKGLMSALNEAEDQERGDV